MLLSNRPSSTRKLLGFVAFMTFCLIIFYYCQVGGFGDWNWDIAVLPTYSNSAASQMETKIPEKLWYKLGAKSLSDECRAWIDTCLNKNPSYQYEFMTDDSSDEYVRQHFADRPDVVDAYLALSIPILKADIIRYLLLLREGGIYNDLDVSCEDTPFADWVPEEYKQNASLVVGWEFDVGWGDHFMREFATWTMMAKPESPHLSMLIDDIIVGLHEKTEENNVSIAGLTFDMIGDVVDLTGPRRMTNSIIKSLELSLNQTIEMETIGNLLEPKLVGDVLILPGYSFANSSNTYLEGQGGVPLVTHHYAGTWKNENGGELP